MGFVVAVPVYYARAHRASASPQERRPPPLLPPPQLPARSWSSRTLGTPKGRFDPSPNPSLRHKHTSNLLSPASNLPNTPRIDALAAPPGSWTSPHPTSPATAEPATVMNAKPVPTPSTATSRSPTISQFSPVAPNPTGAAKTTYHP